MVQSTPRMSTLSLHDALPIWLAMFVFCRGGVWPIRSDAVAANRPRRHVPEQPGRVDRGDRSPGRAEPARGARCARSEEHTSELQSQFQLVCRHLLEKKKNTRL